MNRRVAVQVSALSVLCIVTSGCRSLIGPYQRYERPELFHPTTAILKQQLARASKSGANRQRTVEPPLAGGAMREQSLGEVETPELFIADELKTDDRQVHEIRISDDCVPPQLPIIQAEPAAMIVTPVTAEAHKPRWFKAAFDASKVPGFIGDLDITVIGCAASNLSATHARAAGLLKTAKVRIGYKRLETKYNIWTDGDVENEFGAEFARTFIVADAVFENPNDKPILLYGSSLSAQVRFLASVEDVRKVLGQPVIDNPELLNTHLWHDRPASEALDFIEYYRPLAYSDILAIFSYQQESDPRQRTISTLKSFGEIAAGAAVFVSGVDYGTGVALFTGVLIPELEKQLLWDVLKHLKNLESRSLKEVEEIAERGELRRVVFFPRRAIPNFVPPFPMYIAEISLENVPVKAVLLEKQATISNGSQSAQSAQD